MADLVTVAEMARAEGTSEVEMLTRLQRIGVDVQSGTDFVNRDTVVLNPDRLLLVIGSSPHSYRRRSFHIRERTRSVSMRLPADIVERVTERLMAVANQAHAALRRERPSNADKSNDYEAMIAEAIDAYRDARSFPGGRDVVGLADSVGEFLYLASAAGVQIGDAFADFTEAVEIISSDEPEVLYETKQAVAEAPLLLETVSDSLLALLAREPNLLFDVTPRKFEEIIAELFYREGYEVELTKATRDGGKDIVAISRRMNIVTKLIIECKRYRHDRKVDLALVHRLLGVKVASAASKAILATTSAFTRDAQKFARDHFWDLELKDLNDIRRWLQPYA